MRRNLKKTLGVMLSCLLDDGRKEAAAMVIDAMLVSGPKDFTTSILIRLRAGLEQTYDPQKALQTFSE